jgi:hypothetical protein
MGIALIGAERGGVFKKWNARYERASPTIILGRAGYEFLRLRFLEE